MAEASGSPPTALATFDRHKQLHSDKIVLLLLLFSLSWVDLLIFGRTLVSFFVSHTEVVKKPVSPSTFTPLVRQ